MPRLAVLERNMRDSVILRLVQLGILQVCTDPVAFASFLHCADRVSRQRELWTEGMSGRPSVISPKKIKKTKAHRVTVTPALADSLVAAQLAHSRAAARAVASRLSMITDVNRQCVYLLREFVVLCLPDYEQNLVCKKRYLFLFV